jgi:phage shock protein PspC (stress-responsive transcriptional regulator)
MTWNDSPQDQPSPSSESWGQPRRLERRRDGKVFGGVCAGIADYFNVDVTLVRLAAVVLALTTGIAVPAYLVAWLIVPAEGSEQSELEKLLDRSGLGGRPSNRQAA